MLIGPQRYATVRQSGWTEVAGTTWERNNKVLIKHGKT